jgi:RND superfamily putative drug exporter
LLVLALSARHLQLGLPGNESEPASSTQHQSYDLLAEGFGPGFNAALAVVVDATGIPASRRPQVLAQLAAILRHDPDIADVAPPVASPAGTIAVLSVVPETGPDTAATSTLVHRMRDDDLPLISRAGGTGYVAGNTAADIDVSGRLGSALPVFIAIIVVLAFILLMIAFRSLLVPLTAVIGVLFGLAMDYEVFLISRMRERFELDRDPRAAVAAGLQRSGRVVCAAALIMTAVFAGFIPADDPIVKSIAFALTTGVLIDAFVVRLTIIPAAMTLLGQPAWPLPARLDRVLPHADIEGASLPSPARPANPEQVPAT